MTLTKSHLEHIDLANFYNVPSSSVRKYSIIPSYWVKACIFSIVTDVKSKSNYYIAQQLWIRYNLSPKISNDLFSPLWESSYIDLMNNSAPEIKRANQSFIDACSHYQVEYQQTCENCLFKYCCFHSF